MKYSILFCLALMGTFAQAQTFEAGQLWETKGVYSPEGELNERAKINEFFYVKDAQTLYLLDISDVMNMETGETTIRHFVDTFALAAQEGNRFPIKGKDKFVIERYGQDSMAIVSERYAVSFKLLDVKPYGKRSKLQKILIGNTFRVYPEGKDPKNLLMTYLDENNKKYAKIDGSSDWESPYIILDFNGFLILQGITSPPLLVTKVKKKAIEGWELDYRFAPQKVSHRRGVDFSKVDGR